MAGTLYIAEKPDVGRELSAFLAKKAGGSPSRQKGYFEIPGGDMVTWCIGHLIEQAGMDHYLAAIAGPGDVAKDGRVRWRAEHLPCLPEQTVWMQSSDKKEQIQTIKSLAARAKRIVHAADRDREGQAIVDNLLRYLKCDKKVPVDRMIFSALDDDSIEKALSKIESNDQPKFRNLGLSAISRSEADWAVGLNMTRICTVLHSNEGVLSVGRVQTPLLAVIVARHYAILNFKVSTFYVPSITLEDGRVIEWKGPAGGERPDWVDESGRITDPKMAQRIVDEVNANGVSGIVTDNTEATEKKKPPPLPFSLDALRSEMSKRHGLPVEETTKACQSLYEKKMQTYVGTDSRYLPESMREEAGKVLNGLAEKYSADVSKVDLSKKYACWNDKKVTAHHAIIPTGIMGKADTEAEQLVYDAVCRRYMAQFYPEYRYLESRLEGNFSGQLFGATQKIPVSPGWKAVDEDGASDEVENQDLSKPKDGLTNTMKSV